MSPTRVIKVGGSLLDWPPLPGALQTWLGGEPPAFNVLICGGGALADTIRKFDRDFSLGQEAAHWLCIDALSISARLLGDVLRGFDLIAKYDELAAAAERGEFAFIVFDPHEFLRDHEARLPGCKLPHNWSVTSDSIAARLAEVLQAQELVLLKSRDQPVASLSELASAGFVDQYFPIAAAGVRKMRIINLRRGAATPLPCV